MVEFPSKDYGAWLGILKASADNEPHVDEPKLNAAWQAYLQYYGFAIGPHIQQRFSYSRFQGESIFSQSFIPAASKAHVLILHGYYDHSGSFARLCNTLLSRSIAVHMIDLPGSGLSSGARGCIQDFGDYERLLADHARKIKAATDTRTLYGIGHSLGGGLLLGLLASNSFFTNCCGATPFLKPRGHDLIARIEPRLRGLIAKVPRFRFPTSYDSGFVKQQREDPLQSPVTNMQWVRAYQPWQERISALSASSARPLLLYAKNDHVINWRYSEQAFARLFPNAEQYCFARARHHLLNEATQVRIEVYNLILEWLSRNIESELESHKAVK